MTSPRNLFVIYAPDYTDPECLARRLSVRPKHLERVDGLIQGGVEIHGGAMLSPESVTGDKKMVGSIMVVSAETMEKARELIEADVYYTGNVWDKEKLILLPFVPAVGFK